MTYNLYLPFMPHETPIRLARADTHFFVALCLGFAVLCALPRLANAAGSTGNVGNGLIGNTVVLTGPAGVTQIFYRDRNNLLIRMADGKTKRGWWRVKGRSLCTRTGDAPENCTDPMDVPPVAGSSGTIDSPDGTSASITWEVKRGKAFK